MEFLGLFIFTAELAVEQTIAFSRGSMQCVPLIPCLDDRSSPVLWLLPLLVVLLKHSLSTLNGKLHEVLEGCLSYKAGFVGVLYPADDMVIFFWCHPE